MTIVWFVVGSVVGGVIALLIGNSRFQGIRSATEARAMARETEIAGLRDGIAAKDRVIEEKAREVEALRGTAEAARLEAGRLLERLGAEQRAAEERIHALMDMEKSLKTSFQALAGEALDANSRRLIALAKGELDKQQMESAKDLAAKESAIEKLLKPMQDSLAKLSTHSQDLELKREGAYREVLTEIQNMQNSHRDLRKETTQLVAALRAPQVRGNWGQMQLKKCVEFAGMLQFASFEVEKFVRGEEVSIRPDMVVKLPNGRSIIVDAKTPLDAFLNASACEDETQQIGRAHV